MAQRVHRRRSSAKRTKRWMVAAIVLCSTMSCVAPVLYASDCSRWIAEYQQGILQRRAALRLRAAKFRLTRLVRPAPAPHRYPSRHPMGPLEALRRFQIDCGDLSAPELAPKLPAPPIVPKPLFVNFPELPPPDLPLPTLAAITEAVPPLADVPITSTPVENVSLPSPVPEPAPLTLVLSGVVLGAALFRRRSSRPEVSA